MSAQTVLPEIDGCAATRFGLLLNAVKNRDIAMAADMLTSIPATDLAAIQVRLAAFGIDLRDLFHNPEGDRA